MLCTKVPLPSCYGESYDSDCDVDCPWAMDCMADMDRSEDDDLGIEDEPSSSTSNNAETPVKGDE